MPGVRRQKGAGVRFEVITAFTIGILLPILETYRRGVGYWGVEFTTMFEDYVDGKQRC